MARKQTIKLLSTSRFYFVKTFIIFLCLMCGNLRGIAEPKKRAFLIGISDYPICKYDTIHSWNKIHGTNDVNLIERTLRKQGFLISKLHNANASAAKIKGSFHKLIADIRSGDIVYVHFSGHGQPVYDISGDEDDEWDEAIIPYDAMQVYHKGIYEGENHILDDELNLYIESLRKKVGPTGMVYIVVDACHAGSAYRGGESENFEFTRGSAHGFSAKVKEYVPRIDKRSKIKICKSNKLADVCVIEACRSYQTNSEIKENGKFYGPLSYYINMVLSKEMLGSDIGWTNRVRDLMDKDARLIKQNMVVETSK